MAPTRQGGTDETEGSKRRVALAVPGQKCLPATISSPRQVGTGRAAGWSTMASVVKRHASITGTGQRVRTDSVVKLPHRVAIGHAPLPSSENKTSIGTQHWRSQRHLSADRHRQCSIRRKDHEVQWHLKNG
jgi:hypothetical protein